jgi:hypothetical protein
MAQINQNMAWHAVFLFTSRNLANAGFAWHVVLIASFAVLKLLRNNVYVSITACFVNWKYKIKFQSVEISSKQD